MLNVAEQNQQKRTESANLIMELIRMGESSFLSVETEEKYAFIGKNKDRVREIGIRLDFLGGIDLMDFASQHISVCHRPELNIAWENIGEWNV